MLQLLYVRLLDEVQFASQQRLGLVVTAKDGTHLLLRSAELVICWLAWAHDARWPLRRVEV